MARRVTKHQANDTDPEHERASESTGGGTATERKLSLKQKLFCEYYLGKAKGNATEAARLAGYAGEYDVLKTVGAENLTKPYIRQYIQQRFKEAARVDADEVMVTLARIMRGDLGDFINEDKSINVFGGDTRLIRKYRKTDDSESIELYSSFDAAREIAELMGMKVQRHAHSVAGPDGGDIPVRVSGDLGTSEQLAKRLLATLQSAPPEERDRLIELGERLFSTCNELSQRLQQSEGTNSGNATL